MTTPTQAQIEAAARVLYVKQGGNFESWGVVDETVRVSFRLAAVAALTAAAEAGSTDKVCEGYGYGWRAAFESTLEQCAQVADEFEGSVAIVIAARIRALKEGGAEVREPRMSAWDARYSGSAKEIEDHTIERCAKVADMKGDRVIADRIRALKEKP